MKKILCVSILLVIITAVSASADVFATLSRSNDDKAPYNENFRESLVAVVFDKDFTGLSGVKLYDSLTLMQMALERGDVDLIASPEFVGEYILRSNKNYKLRGFSIAEKPFAFAFGFLEEKAELRDRFSRAVEAMEREGVIGILARDFITGPSAANPPAVSFEKFDDAETLNVALTGDQPPLDYVAADGKPSGFNTAMLAEVGKRLHVNINPIIVETGARAVALKSGRADVVFWFQLFEGYDKQPDVPEGVITSTPYYGWNKSIFIGKK
ncbi:MAG: transporter substrate-binding domain-containing protein [Synergistaceae bacterium]|nr:transporter substrate-binding domain-containing protein [Synergistaceae bacterium]